MDQSLLNWICSCALFFLVAIPIEGSSCTHTCIDRRIQAHRTIGDFQSARQEVEKAIELDPDNPEFLRLHVQCLADLQEISPLLIEWSRFCAIKKGDLDRQLLEEIAWAIICKSSSREAPAVRFEAMISAFFANDVRGIPICIQALQDPNVSIRTTAIALTSRMNDEELQKIIFDIFLHDESPEARRVAITTLGAMRSQEALEPLQAILTSDHSSLQEKEAAITAISDIITKVDPSMIDELSKNSRALLRILGCYLAVDQLDDSLLQIIEERINDSSSDVRLIALQSLGIMYSSTKKTKVVPALLKDLIGHPHVETAITANWLLLIIGSAEEKMVAQENLKKWLFSTNPRVRLFAAASIGSTGRSGLLLAKEVMQESADPLVRINLASYMIWQRNDIFASAQRMAKDLSMLSDRLSWENFGVFTYIGSNCTAHVDGSESVPEITDVQTRLDLYGMLATCQCLDLCHALKTFLKDRAWGITGQTASIMLREGLETLEAFQMLLSDPSPTVSLQAAFILALYSQNREALKVLELQYKSSPRIIKERILYAIGAIGDFSALPFLIEVLGEPFESLRVLAARAILQCLEK